MEALRYLLYFRCDQQEFVHICSFSLAHMLSNRLILQLPPFDLAKGKIP